MKKSVIEILKYNVILAFILFLSSNAYLIKNINQYNLSTYTISSLSKFLSHQQLSFFNTMFFIKSFLDFGFIYYLVKFLNLKIWDPSIIFLSLAILSFGLLGFFPNVYYPNEHLIIVVVMFFSWFLAQYFLSKKTNDEKFIYLTKNFITIEIASGILFTVGGNFNGILEIFYMFLISFWLLIFIRDYLK
ncbi:MAG: hypothetical protein Fur009_1870 [Candidatus Microgenomates bacterium]